MACIVDPTALLVWHVLLRLCKWVVGDIETRLWLREQRLASLIWATGESSFRQQHLRRAIRAYQ